MKLSIVIPVYNEQATILSVIKNVEAVQLQEGLSKEIIVINDGSTDGTKKKLNEFAHHPLIKVFSYYPNKGKTEAVKQGIEKSTGDIILIQDADLEYSPDHYPSLLEPLLNQKASIVYGSRFRGNIQNMTLINWLANKISNATINFLYHTQMTDFHTCFKIFKRMALENIIISSRNFSFDTEITVKFLKKGYNIYEIPITYRARKKKKEKR